MKDHLTAKREWSFVESAWEQDSIECATCEFRCLDYSSDTGYDSWCSIIEDHGNPQFCAALERLSEEERE